MEVDLNDVLVFTEVVNEGGFSRAARKLDLPASAVSRRVARLEERLGFKLLHRTTRRVGLTDFGEIYFAKTSAIGRQLEDAERALADSRRRPSGLLRVTAPPDDGGVIWQLLSGFVRSFPKVDLEIIHTLEYLDLIEARVDVALRGGAAPDSTEFTAHRLFESRILLAASPAYLAARGTPTRVEDLESHDCICMDRWAPNAIRRLDGDRGLVKLQVRNRVRANRLDTAHAAARDGFGIAPVLQMTCQRELDSGALVEVLPGALPDSSPFWAVYPKGRKASMAAQALIKHLIAAAPAITSA
ncbi:MAG: LysR family transcriptional regulator [Myxococcota bacterium]